MSARKIIDGCIVGPLEERYRTTDAILSALTAAGYRIVPPGGLDAESVERGVAALDELFAEAKDRPAWGECTAALRSLIEEPTNDAR